MPWVSKHLRPMGFPRQHSQPTRDILLPFVLVTNGAAGEIDPQMDAFVTGSHASGLKLMGVAVANAAKDKLVGMLAQRLEDDGVYVGQVTIAGTIKGTAWDSPDSIDPSDVADKFWQLYQDRSAIRARMS